MDWMEMDWIEDSRRGRMRDRVLSKPNLLREIVPKFNRQVRAVLDHETSLGVKRVYTAGSGDSHMAGVATELAFEAIAGLPMEPHTGMGLGRYTIPWLSPHDAQSALVIGTSVSGEVLRTVETLQLAREKGTLTLALTFNLESSLAKVARLVFDTTVDDRDVPGVRTYLSSLVALYSVALRLGEVRDTITQEQGGRWREAMLRVADTMEATNIRISDGVRECAQALREKQSFMFLGSGPNYGTALFGAAKIIEATGRHATSRGIEEWAHEERFGVEPEAPTFLIAPPGLSYGRAVQIAQAIKRFGKYLVAVVQEGEQPISKVADVVLPVCGQVPEPLTPLVYCNALELFASDLAQEVGETYLRAGTPFLKATPLLIRASEAVDSLGALHADEITNPDG